MATDSRFDGPGPDAQFLQALGEGRVMLQHCQDCAAVRFPPALVCRRCGSPRLDWRASPGQGTVYSTTTVRDRAGDYNVAIVELEGGARMMSRVEGVGAEGVRNYYSGWGEWGNADDTPVTPGRPRETPEATK